MALFLPRRWRRQPQGVVGIDWSNPLTKGLIHAWNLNGTGTDSVRNAWPATNNGGSYKGSSGGLGFSGNASGSQRLDIGSGQALPSTSFCQIILADIGNATADNMWGICGSVNANDGYTLYTGSGFAYTANPGSSFALVSLSLATGLHSVVSQVSSGTFTAYFDKTSASASYSPATPINRYSLGALGTTAIGFNGTQINILYFDSGQADAKIRELVDNPWQVYVPQRSVLYFLGTAGGTDTTLTPSAGSLTFTGFAPTVGQSYERTPSVGTLTFTGYAASVAVGGDRTLTPGVGSLTLFGFAPFPTVDNNTYLTTGLGALTLTGYAPTVAAPLNLIPGVGSVSLTGYAPTVGQTYSLTPGVGSAAFTGYAPTIGVGYSLQIGLGALTLTGYAPTVGRTYSMTPAAGSLALTGYQATVTATGQSIWTNISEASTTWTNQSAASTIWTNI